MQPGRIAALAALGLLAACQRPPASAYVTTHNTALVALGSNEVGEPCTQDAGPGAREAAISCGKWDQPAAHAVGGDPASPDTLQALASSGPWRARLDQRLSCETAPVPTSVLGEPALLLRCTRRIGGWPQVALVTVLGGRAWYADGVQPSLPVMERAIGVLSGRLPADTAAQHAVSPALAAQRLAGSLFSANDLGQYEDWMQTATRANQAGDYADARKTYRSIAELQRRVLGPNSPALSRTLAGEAVQASNLGRFGEADRLLDAAESEATAPGQSDVNAIALVWHYRGLDLLTQGHPERALSTLRNAEGAYAANLSADQLGANASSEIHADRRVEHAIATSARFSNSTSEAALVGVIETRRAEAVALKRLNRLPESRIAADSARSLAVASGRDAPPTMARLMRTSAFVAEANGQQDLALTDLEASDKYFAAGMPGSVSYATTTLLLAKRQFGAGQGGVALQNCRASLAALRAAGEGIDPALLQPCMLQMYAQAQGPDGAAIRTEMFEAAELAQGGVTSAQIAEASARLSENARDPRVAALIRERTDLTARLNELLGQRAAFAASDKTASDATADTAVEKLRRTLASKNEALQAASPRYGSLVQTAVEAREVLAALRPNEAFCSIVLGGDGGWSFLLRDGQVSVAPISGGEARMAALVARVRVSLDAGTTPPPPFDTAAASELYQAIFGRFAAQLKTAQAMTVAPSGPLLSIPFELLLTGQADPASLATAPWLVQRMVIAHVPAPANFVGLRKLAGTSRASAPWFGFGDFQRVSLAQAQASFPPAACGDSARLLADLAPLPGATHELAQVQHLTHAPAGAELLGADFTADAVLHADLKHTRILHFATHALLSTDLKCQTEPALVTSAPRDATSASGALLTASDVAGGLDLDADAVILSACNTGGPAGGQAGESLSGLARSFFYAGARSLLVTHWNVNDRVAAALVAASVGKAQEDRSLGMAGGLAAAQRTLLTRASGEMSWLAHPFYWAPLALIGDGGAVGGREGA